MNWFPTLRVFLSHGGRDFFRHKTLSLLNLLALAVGVAAIVAIQTVNETALRSFRASLDLVAGRPDFTIEGQGFRLPEKLILLLRNDPAVREVTPTIQLVASLPDHPGEFLHLVGVDPFSNQELVTYRLEDALRSPTDAIAFVSEPDTIALTRPLADRLHLRPGDTLRAVSAGHQANLRVRFMLEPSPDLLGADDHLAIADIATVQSSFALGGQIDRIEALLRPDASGKITAVRSSLLERLAPNLPAHARAGSPERRGQEVEKMLGAFQLNLTALSLIALVVGMFLVTNTVAANVARRRAELGLLRSLGLDRRSVIILIVGESLLLALLGAGLGIFVGLQVARILLQSVSSTVTSHYVLLSMQDIIVNPWSLVGAGLAGLLAAGLAAWWPAREASLVSPVDALQPGNSADRASSPQSSFLRASLLCLFFTLLFSVTALYARIPRTGFLAALGILLAAAFLAPVFGRLLGGLPSLPNASGKLAHSAFLRGLHRHGLAAAALSVAVAMAIGVTIMVHSFRATVDQWIGESIKADLFIAPSTNLIAGALEPLDPQAETLALATPGVRAVGTYREIRLFLDGTPAKLAACRLEILRAYNPLTFLSTLPGDPYELCQKGDYAIISENFARRRQLKTGDKVSLPTPTGTHPLQVAAIFRDYTSESGLLLLDRSTYRRLTEDQGLTSLAIHLEPGVSPQTVGNSLREQLRPRGEFLVYSQAGLRDEALRIFDRSFAVTALLRTLAIAVAALGVTLSLTALGVERTREIGILRATGASRNQILRTIMIEAAYLGATGISIGFVTGFAVALILMQVINRAFFGWTIDWHTPYPSLVGIIFGMMLACLLASLPPAWRASRLSPAEALRSE
ncbi:MAG: FtsX-like permease family protein [Verrucomicrobia bacterium]|nr:FtsX-like permease family protein [Verrucomicrobiota bacterium]